MVKLERSDLGAPTCDEVHDSQAARQRALVHITNLTAIIFFVLQGEAKDVGHLRQCPSGQRLMPGLCLRRPLFDPTLAGCVFVEASRAPKSATMRARSRGCCCWVNNFVLCWERMQPGCAKIAIVWIASRPLSCMHPAPRWKREYQANVSLREASEECRFSLSFCDLGFMFSGIVMLELTALISARVWLGASCRGTKRAPWTSSASFSLSSSAGRGVVPFAAVPRRSEFLHVCDVAFLMA